MQTPYRKPGKYTQTKQDPHITQAKFDELENKLKKLKAKKPFLASEVSRLAQNGDFSENASYQAAKRKLRSNLSHILKTENQLNHAIIISPKNKKTVSLGHTVTVKINNKEKTFQILGSTETDPAKNIISHHSPIGSALIGRKVGDEFVLDIGGKKNEYRIVSIS